MLLRTQGSWIEDQKNTQTGDAALFVETKIIVETVRLLARCTRTTFLGGQNSLNLDSILGTGKRCVEDATLLSIEDMSSERIGRSLDELY